MKLIKKSVEIICALCIVISSVYSVVMLEAVTPSVTEKTLTDGSQWLVRTDFDSNTFSTDGDGRYIIKTNAPGTEKSAFSLMSQNTFPISTKFQLQCGESGGAVTAFGLSSDYSLDLDDSSSIRIVRQNGNPSENAVKLSVVINGKTECIKTTGAYYTRIRVSTIGVAKKNDSYYMTWNDEVLDGEGCSEEVKEYCKLENHFSKSYLDANASLHIYAECSSLLYADVFSLKADRVISDGIMKESADNYPDPNDPSKVTKTPVPKAQYDSDTGTYNMEFKNDNTSVTPMAPVAFVDSDKDESEEYQIKCYLKDYNNNTRYWMSYWFSNDPTFSDGTEIQVWNARIEGGAVHFGSGSVTFFGLNANYYNDPNDSERYMQFRRNKSDGKLNLYLWGGNLVAANAPECVSADFSALVGKPIYMKVRADGLAGATVTIKLTPSTGADTSSEIQKVEKLSSDMPSSLEKAEEIIAEYDSSPYRFAISSEAMAKILKIRNYMLSEREANLQRTLKSIRNDIDKLPSSEQMHKEYKPEYKDTICNIYLRYIALEDNMSKLGDTYVNKLMEDIDALSDLDADFAEKKKVAEQFENNVNSVGADSEISVENYNDKKTIITSLLKAYDDMDEFQKSLVTEGSIKQLDKLKDRMDNLKNAFDAVELIKLLPEPSQVTYSNNQTILSARDAFNRVPDVGEIPEIYKTKLSECENALDEAKIRELDWYSKNPEVTYTGDNVDSYEFKGTANKVSGVAYATTTHKYNMINDKLYWVGMTCGSGQFMLLNLTNDVRATNISQTTTDNICFVLRPTAAGLNICFYDAKGEAEYVGSIGGFDYGGLHTFEFVKNEDNNWYICIDGKVLNDYNYNRFNNFMETYGDNCNVAIGGMNGFDAGNVIIKDKNAVSGEGDWSFSLPFGCSAQGTETANLKLKNGAQAVCQKLMTGLDGWKIGINFNLRDKPSDTFVGFLTNKEANTDYTCGNGNGVCLRFINHPSPNDYRTHILLLVNNQWITLCAKEPAIIDAKDFTLSVIKDIDRHYYFQVDWESGSTKIKLDRTSEYYRNLQLDKLVENGGYFTVGTNNSTNINILMTYSEPQEEEEEDNTATIEFILDFEKHIDNLAKRSVSDYEYISKKWQGLDFFTKNNVSADLMEDDYAYNILMNVKDYKDGDLSEYYYTTETVTVPTSDVKSVIDGYINSGDGAEYTFTYPDGTVIYSDMGMTNGTVPGTGDNQVFVNAIIILMSAISISCVSYFKLRKLKNKNN